MSDTHFLKWGKKVVEGKSSRFFGVMSIFGKFPQNHYPAKSPKKNVKKRLIKCYTDIYSGLIREKSQKIRKNDLKKLKKTQKTGFLDFCHLIQPKNVYQKHPQKTLFFAKKKSARKNTHFLTFFCVFLKKK